MKIKTVHVAQSAILSALSAVGFFGWASEVFFEKHSFLNPELIGYEAAVYALLFAGILCAVFAIASFVYAVNEGDDKQ